MKTKLYWGLTILFVLLIGVSVFILLRNTDTEPIKVYKTDVEPTYKPPQKDRESTQTPAESTTPPAEKPTTHNIDEETETKANDGTKTNDSTKKPVRISRFGFGVLPDIPDEAPIAPFDDDMDADDELLALTLFKLWNDGDKDIGGGWYDPQTRKVYPHYDDVIYVEYELAFNYRTFKEEIMITGATSGYGNRDVVQEVVKSGKAPPGYKLIDVEESGIDPYVFLDLPIK